MSFRDRKNRTRLIEQLEARMLLSGSHLSASAARPTVQSTLQVFEPLAPSAPPAGALPAAVSYPTPIPGTMSPARIQEAYAFDNVLLPNGSAAAGAGQTIAIVDAFDDPNIQSDLHTFDQQYFGGVDPVFTKINLGATATLSSPEEWELEESLDVEWAHAVAPQANILLVEAASNSTNDLMAAVDKAVSTGAPIVSMSFGLVGGENSNETTWDSHFAVPDVAFVASSGDVGAPAMWPAASPAVIGVGGTSLAPNSNNDWSSETGWFDGGGGVSLYESRPAFQPTTYTNGATTGIALAKRGVPDVAYDAARESAMSVFDSFPHSNPRVFNGTQTGWFAVGGTSAGAPQWAGILALADQGRAQLGAGPLGTTATLTALYANLGDFHDITTGTSTGTPNLSAGAGYDLVGGLGSPQTPLVVSTLIGSAPTSSPATPTGLWALPNDGQVSLSWNASSGAAGWDVYRSTDSVTYTLDATVQSTTFTDTALTNGVNYYYQVSAVNAVGESPLAAPVSTTPQIPPAPPTLQSATPSDNTFNLPDFSFAVTLQWTPSSAASGYDVLRSETSGGGYAVIASGVTATSYTDTSVYAASTFYYVIRAVNAAGARSGYSAQLSAKTIPGAPANLTATSARAQVALAWSATTGATSYNILRSTTNGSGYTLIATGVTTTTFTNTGLTNGVTYYYVIQAVDSSGPSANSSQASATPTKNGH